MPSTLRRLAALPLLAGLALSKPAFEGPKPPLRRIVDTPDLPFDISSFDNLIVGGGPADPASSSFAVALVTDYRVSPLHAPTAPLPLLGHILTLAGACCPLLLRASSSSSAVARSSSRASSSRPRTASRPATP